MITLVPTPIGNLGDISLRALEAIDQSEVVLCEDTRVTKKLFSLLKKNPLIFDHFPNIFKEKCFFSFHSHNQEEFLKTHQIDFFQQNVVFLSDAGMPCINDPGALLVSFAQKHHIAYDIVAGSNACLLAYCMSGIINDGFIFGGFLPHKREDRRACLREFFSHTDMQRDLSVIFYESPHRILEAMRDIDFVDKECEVFAIKEMTKRNQKFFKGKAYEVLEILKDQNINGEWVLLLSPQKKKKQMINIDEILQMDLPPKIKAKILARAMDTSPKDLYEQLIKQRDFKINMI